jgi:outer membrane murein-binding lipoprotein Lpp
VKGLNSKFDGLSTEVKGLNSKFDGLSTEVKGLNSKFDGLSTEVKGLDSKFDGLSAQVAHLGVFTPTADKEEQARSCASSAVVYVALVGASTQQCSATPVPAALLARANLPVNASSSSFFLTAGHCLFNMSTTNTIMLDSNPTIAVGNFSLACTVLGQSYARAAVPERSSSTWNHTSKDPDLAIISCPAPVPVPPSTLVDASASLPLGFVATAGYSRGSSIDEHACVLFHSGIVRSSALSRVTPTLLTPSRSTSAASAAGDESSSSDEPRPRPAESFDGFLTVGPAQGQSGGPVFTLSCEVIGMLVAHVHELHGGIFLNFSSHVVQTKIVNILMMAAPRPG